MTRAELDALIEGATVDCYNDEEQITGLFTMLEEHLAFPFQTAVLGMMVTVEKVDLSLDHLEDVRPSTLLFHLTQRLLYTKWRDPGEAPKLHLFGQLKRITREWLDNRLVCKGSTHPAQLPPFLRRSPPRLIHHSGSQ